VGAIDDFSVAIEIMPERGSFYFNRATERFFIKDFEAAIEDFTDAIEKMEDPQAAYYFRGKLYYENKDYDKAIEDLKMAHELKPDDRRTTELLFTARMVLLFSRYWIYILAFLVLFINGFRLYRRNRG
jgi:tetratricopeptide (TPR) repeat protein